MKFKKFGKALLMGALSVGVILGVTSCVRSYTVGFLYVTGTVTGGSGGNGAITGFKIDHNTGQLIEIHGLPISSGGANPVRAVLTVDSRFLYVLNRGTTASGGSDCTTADPCQNANITEFAAGGNGILTPQQTFYTQGVNPFRLLADGGGRYLFVLDHDAPDNYAASYNPSTNGCTLALGSGVETCGDITVFQIDQTTGRLSLVENAQVTAAGGAALTYFPVPANPVDFVNNGSYVLTLSSSSTQASYPYTGGSSVFPYQYYSTTGQLTVSSSSSQPLSISQGTAIVEAGAVIYVLDNEAPDPNPTGASSQILPFTVGSNGALQAEPGGIVPDDSTLANPIYVLQTNGTNRFVYVANQGNQVSGQNAASGIAGYFLTTSNPSFQLTFIAGEPWGSGAGPQCIVEDPSSQFIYEANEYDSTVTGQVLDPNAGVLSDMRVSSAYSLPGPATWCLMDGRTG
jgi:6-phosphogluconolactonase (cycloisomerase 2 family)